MRIFLERREPLCRAVLEGVREKCQRLTLTQLHHERELAIDVGARLMESIVITLTVFDKCRAKDITTVAEESVDRSVVGQAELLPHLFVLDFDERLIVPLLRIEDPGEEHLLGFEALVGAMAIKFLGKVYGEGLHGADTLVVVDEQMTEAASRFLRHRCLRLCRE